MLVPDEVKYFALREGRHLMSILSMTIKQTVDLNFSIEQDKEIVLVWLIYSATTAHEFNVFLQKQLFVLSLEMSIYRLLFKQGLVREEKQLLLLQHKGIRQIIMIG